MRKLLLTLAAALLVTVSAHAADSVAGKWTGQAQGRNGPQPMTLELKAAGGALTGAMTTGDNPAIDIEDGKTSGANVSFAITRTIQGNEVKIPWSGAVMGDQLTLTRGQIAGAPAPAQPPAPVVLTRAK